MQKRILAPYVASAAFLISIAACSGCAARKSGIENDTLPLAATPTAQTSAASQQQVNPAYRNIYPNSQPAHPHGQPQQQPHYAAAGYNPQISPTPTGATNWWNQPAGQAGALPSQQAAPYQLGQPTPGQYSSQQMGYFSRPASPSSGSASRGGHSGCSSFG